MKIKCWICNRLKEPSTWAALSVPFATWGAQMHEPYSHYIYSIAAFCGILAIIFKEGSSNAVGDSKKVLVGNSGHSNNIASKLLAGKSKPAGRDKKRSF